MKISLVRVLCWLLATALLAGCGGKDAASFIASAKSYIAKADYKAATIEIKKKINAHFSIDAPIQERTH